MTDGVMLTKCDRTPKSNAQKQRELKGVSLDIENYCTLRLFFDLSTLAGLSRRNLPEAGIRLLFQI